MTKIDEAGERGLCITITLTGKYADAFRTALNAVNSVPGPAYTEISMARRMVETTLDQFVPEDK